MKNIITIFTLLVSLFTFAQVPQGISYQAIALNSAGLPIVSSNVGIRLSVLDNSPSGTNLYTETQTKTTNSQGLFNLVIGQGTPTSGVFSGINWGTNSKFLKVELDVAGGTNYVLVGTTQLLSVPYALASDSLITSPGEGITLVSPNGTPYQVTVNDSGELSLPTSGLQNNVILNQLFLYGSFNNWDPNTALQFGNYNGGFLGYKYFAAGTQVKFLTAQNSNVVYGGNGNNVNGNVVLNGTPITIPSNGFYKITVQGGTNGMGSIVYNYYFNSINTELFGSTLPGGMNMSYNTTQNFLFYSVNQTTTNTGYKFRVDTTGSYIDYGDNLNDGFVEVNGVNINVPTTGTKLFKFYLNFNGTGNYTIN